MAGPEPVLLPAAARGRDAGGPGPADDPDGPLAGQPAIGELIGKCGIQCRPVRNLLVTYLAERQPALDFSTLRRLADDLGRLFWRDLEVHHPGIDSLALSAEAATAWKQRIKVKPARAGHPPPALPNPE